MTDHQNQSDIITSFDVIFPQIMSGNVVIMPYHQSVKLFSFAHGLVKGISIISPDRRPPHVQQLGRWLDMGMKDSVDSFITAVLNTLPSRSAYPVVVFYSVDNELCMMSCYEDSLFAICDYFGLDTEAFITWWWSQTAKHAQPALAASRPMG